MSGVVGRPALPENVHALRGTAVRKPASSLLDDVVRPPVEIPECPSFLTGEARAEWERITPHLETLGLISQIDRAALSGYCAAWADFAWAQRRIDELNGAMRVRVVTLEPGVRQKMKRVAADLTGERGRIGDTPSGYKQISVVVQIRNRALEILTKYLGEFGMSPAARERVTPSAPAAQGDLPGIPGKPKEGGWGTYE